MAIQRLRKLGAMLAKVAGLTAQSVSDRSASPHTDVASALLPSKSNHHQMAMQHLAKLGAIPVTVAGQIQSSTDGNAGPHRNVAPALLPSMSNNHQMPIQSLHKLGAILVKVAGQIESVSDRRAFVQTSFVIYAFAKKTLYWEIDLTDGTSLGFGRQGAQRLEALLRTLQPNLALAASVKYLKVTLVPHATVNDLVRVCTSLQSLHWRIPDEGTWRNRAPWLMPPLPLIPSHVRHLAFEHIGSHIDGYYPSCLQGTITKCLVPASGIRTLSLFTTLQTMSEIFGEIGPQIEDLKVEAHLDGNYGSEVHRQALKTVFVPLTDLKRLRMRHFGSWEARNVILPASLQRLILDAASENDLQMLCQCLCDSSWCPNLQRLPLVKLSLISTNPLMEPVEDRLRRFLSACERAKTACLERSSWLDGPEDFDRWVAKFLSRP